MSIIYEFQLKFMPKKCRFRVKLGFYDVRYQSLRQYLLRPGNFCLKKMATLPVCVALPVKANSEQCVVISLQ